MAGPVADPEADRRSRSPEGQAASPRGLPTPRQHAARGAELPAPGSSPNLKSRFKALVDPRPRLGRPPFDVRGPGRHLPRRGSCGASCAAFPRARDPLSLGCTYLDGPAPPARLSPRGRVHALTTRSQLPEYRMVARARRSSTTVRPCRVNREFAFHGARAAADPRDERAPRRGHPRRGCRRAWASTPRLPGGRAGTRLEIWTRGADRFEAVGPLRGSWFTEGVRGPDCRTCKRFAAGEDAAAGEPGRRRRRQGPWRWSRPATLAKHRAGDRRSPSDCIRTAAPAGVAR